MMCTLTDEELLVALLERLDDKRRMITDLRELTVKLEGLNRKLAESEALKGHFLSNIRNEINNPLAAVTALASSIASGKLTPERVTVAAEIIYDQAFDLSLQMENIFAAAELEAGDGSPEMARTDLATLVRDVVKSFEHRRKEREVSLLLGLPDALPFVTDPHLFTLVIRNIIAGSLDAAPPQSCIEVHLSRGDGGADLEVKDSGPVLTVLQQERLFDRFPPEPPVERKRSRGLSLSVAKGGSDILGGKITVESDASGNRFLFFLPEGAEEPETMAMEENLFLFEPAQAV